MNCDMVYALQIPFGPTTMQQTSIRCCTGLKFWECSGTSLFLFIIMLHRSTDAVCQGSLLTKSWCYRNGSKNDDNVEKVLRIIVIYDLFIVIRWVDFVLLSACFN